ncbi:ribonuclease P protein component [Flavitalea sp.]|nr:ribonuclease P protein component [Flavitalea sp.]
MSLIGHSLTNKLNVIKSSQTLGSTERLKSRKIIELLFKEGKSVAAHPIRITFKLIVDKPVDQQDVQSNSLGSGPSEETLKMGASQLDLQNTGSLEKNALQVSRLPGDLRAGFSVSSRNFKKAVHRNRIKRLLRESYRKQKSTLLDVITREGAQISMAIFIIYTGKELPAYEFVDEKMKLALKKLAGQLR